MLDPIAAIGLAGNILTFIDYSTKVISTSINIYGSASGSTQDTQTSDAIATEMKQFATKLQPPDQIQLSGEEKALCKLATECEGLAKKILELLEKIKPKNPKSISSSLVAGLKTKFYESDRRKLEEQLSDFRAQLNLSLSYLTSSKTQARLDILVASAKDDSSKLQQLYAQLEHLRHGVAIESYSPAAATQLRSLLGMSEHAIDLVIQHRVLESLAFKGMYGRYETVDDAHCKTLRWVFGADNDYGEDTEEYEGEEDIDVDFDAGDENKSVSNTSTKASDEYEMEYKAEDEAKTAARELLLTWMSSGAGIFHVSGKLGSGKSTLMKYLCDHVGTKQFLKQWAGTRELVLANFFFWKPGSNMQKSLAGLIRSLLHDVLRVCPELIPRILPTYWEQIKSTPWQIQSNLSISDKDIRRAFSRLISDSNLYTTHCFCFFIDGLDEYEGTHQEDPKTLVDMLTNWTKNASTTVKICVSSREYNLFMNNFSENQRIRLHILTKSDMTSYVVDKLRHIDRKYQMILAESIVENAEGIFVWVALVVKRIREQIENGACLEALQREIDALPKELDSLFDHILNSLTDSDLRAAYQTFSMVIELEEHTAEFLTLFSLSFLDDFAQDKGCALQKDVHFRSLTPEARALRIESARKRLNACCRGLLEARKDGREPASEIIMITHRSISEFLSSRGQSSRMELYLEGFDPIDTVSQLTLAELWSRDPGDIIKESCFDYVALTLVPLREDSKLDVAPYDFLHSLALAWRRHQDQGDYDVVGYDLSLIPGYVGCRLVDTLLEAINGEEDSSTFRYLRHPIFAAAAHGNYGYVLWELERDASNIPLFTPLRLVYCILYYSTNHRYKYDLKPKAEKQLLNVIDVLHNHHGLCANTASNLFGTYVYPATRDINGNISVDANDAAQFGHKISLWQRILLFCFVDFTKHRHGANQPAFDFYGCIIEKFLEYGADPYFYISAKKSHDLEWDFKIRSGTRERREQWFEVGGFWVQEFEYKNTSLADLVELSRFNNKLRILELIEINTSKIESAIAEENLMLLKELTPFVPGTEELENLEDPKKPPLESNPQETASTIDSVSKKRALAGIFAIWSLKLGFSAAISIAILILGVFLAVVIHRSFS